MPSPPDPASYLLLVGGAWMGVLVAQALAVRHLHPDDVPPVLRGRVVWSSRVRPWLLATAVTLVIAGSVLALQG